MELQFTVAEAITRAAIGTGSGASRDAWTSTEEEYQPPDGTCMGEELLFFTA